MLGIIVLMIVILGFVVFFLVLIIHLLKLLRSLVMLGLFLNNPLNIRFSALNKWVGQVGSVKGFCQFQTVDYGLRAGIILLRSYCRLGFLNVGDIILRFAPPSENNTRKYARFVVRKSGVSRISSVSDVLKIIVQMCFYESHYEVTESYLWNVFNRFGLKEDTFFINPNKFK